MTCIAPTCPDQFEGTGKEWIHPSPRPTISTMPSERLNQVSDPTNCALKRNSASGWCKSTEISPPERGHAVKLERSGGKPPQGGLGSWSSSKPVVGG